MQQTPLKSPASRSRPSQEDYAAMAKKYCFEFTPFDPRVGETRVRAAWRPACGRAPLDARHVLCASTVADAARHASKAHGARSAGSPSAPAHTRRDAMFGAMFGTTRRRLRLASDMRPARLGSATPLGLLGSASSWPPCRLEQALVRMLSSPFCLRSPWWALHAPQAARRSAQQLACRGRRGRASCRASWAGLRRRGACCGGS